MTVTNDVEASGSARPEADAPDPSEHWQEAIEKLRQCLTMELKALEGYDLALTQATHPHVSQRLLELRGDHARRKDLIRSRIERRGPTTDAPASSRIAVAGPGAAPLGDRESVVALEALERRAIGLYGDGLVLDDPSTRAFFETVLVPAQRRTHDLCRSLKGFTAARFPG